MWRRLLIVALISPMYPDARALDPTRAISQYAHSAWRLQDGFLNANPTAVAQTKDGYLWVGTEGGGLLRFDGIRFEAWIPPSGRQLPSQNIYALAASTDGGLWIGTARGLAHWTGSDLVSYPLVGRIVSIMIRGNGEVWVSRTRFADNLGPVCKVSAAKPECYGKADGLEFPYATTLTEDISGQPWIADTTGITRWQHGSSKRYPLPKLTAAEGLDGVQALAASPDNSLLVGIDRAGPGLGLQQFNQGRWKPVVVPGLDGSTLQVSTLFLDRDHGLWIGTVNDGIYRINDSTVNHYSSLNGLSGDFVNSISQDQEGNLWVVTTRGLDNFRDLAVATFSKQQGLSTDQVASVTASATGAVWIGNQGALETLRNGLITSISTKKWHAWNAGHLIAGRSYRQVMGRS